MSAIQFEPVGDHNLDTFVRITRETLWQPVYPGDQSIVREFQRTAPHMRQSTFLIRSGRQWIGRVVAPQFEDYQLIRDLGVRADRDLIAQTAQALLDRAARWHARIVRAIVHEPYWFAFRAAGWHEQKQRATMRCVLERTPEFAPAVDNIRPITGDATEQVGALMCDAYAGTVDDEGESVEQWIEHAREVMGGQYGPYLDACSFVTPASPPFNSGVLVIEHAPRCALIAQVMTRRAQSNRGHARRLLAHSLGALAARGYEQCFLEVTLSNANAIHLYQSLGFSAVGPRITFALRLMSV